MLVCDHFGGESPQEMKEKSVKTELVGIQRVQR